MSTSRRTLLQTAAAGSLLAAVGSPARSPLQDETAEEREKLDLLILGGTGILGPWIVREAISRGHTMTLFNRGRSNPELFAELEQLRGDRDAEDLAALEGREWDAVIDTSGYVPKHVEATASMAATYARQYVFFSSISAYADHAIPYADENSAVREVTDEVADSVKTIREAIQTDYGALKARCEVAAEAAMPGKTTNIRPGLIVGPGDYSDRFGYWAVRVARGGEVLAPGDGSDPVQYIDARDLAAWTIHCIENRVTGVFNGITPAGRFRFDELLHGMKASVVTDAAFTWLPASFLEEEEVPGWTQLPAWVHASGEMAGFHLAKAERSVAAGLAYRPLAETARDTVAWYAESKGTDYEFGQRAGLSREREAEVLAAWHAREEEPPAPAETEEDGGE